MGLCTHCPGHQSPGEVWGRSLHPPLLTPPFLRLQFNHCPAVWQAVPAAPAVFAMASGLGRARGSGDTRLPCPRPRPPARTGPGLCPRHRTPLGPAFRPQAESVPRQCPRRAPGHPRPAGSGGDVSVPCPAAEHRAGLAAGTPKQTRGGSARPHCAVWAGRTRELLVHGGHREVVSLPGSPASRTPPATHGPGNWTGGAKLTGPNLCQATATPAQNISARGVDFKSDGVPGSGGLPGLVGSQWDLWGGIQATLGTQCLWGLSAGGLQAVANSKPSGLPLLMDSRGVTARLGSAPEPTQLAQPGTSSASPKDSRSLSRQDSHPPWQSWAEHQPVFPDRQEQPVLGTPGHCWTQAGSRAPGSSQRAQRELLLP